VTLKFEFTLEKDWPALAWIAECIEADPVVRVRRGHAVETRPAWFCEAVWDGEFESGDFDRTDLIFGSGGRLREGRAIFVSPACTVDRLQFLKLYDRTMISNSLACLLAIGRIKVDPTYIRYPDFFRSIVNGLDSYDRSLPTESGSLKLSYFRNLVWDGRTLCEEDKPAPQRDFSSFDSYRNFLRTSMGRIGSNMRATTRTHAYDMVGALSSGYDSTTATVLGCEAGMRHSFSFNTARGGHEDHGRDVARILGIDWTLANRRDWKEHALAEVPYLAATGLAPDVIFNSVQELLRGRVLLTGFHGDKVWAKDTKSLSPNIVRGDASGLSFTERRLDLCCIHFPVPFMGVRQIGDINTLSNSAELTPWDVPGGYSRPICRRIVEEAGVPRSLFGVSKKAATNLFHQGEALLTETTRAEYHQWLRENKQLWAARGAQTPNVPGRAFLALKKRYYLISRFARVLARLLPSAPGSWLAKKDAELDRWLNRRINLVTHLFPWAIERMSGLYAPQKDANREPS